MCFDSLNIELFYSYPYKKMDIEEQVTVIRNSYAHSQFSSFIRESHSGKINGFYEIKNLTVMYLILREKMAHLMYERRYHVWAFI